MQLPVEFDYHCHIMSLAGIFDTRVDAIPDSKRAYLQADATLIEKWRDIIGTTSTTRPIGIMWSGGSISKIRGRSIALDDLTGLLGVSREFVSLQKEVSEKDLELLKTQRRLRHFGEQQQDFADAAALILNCDFVISVDTSVAHLSAALGKETWILLPFNADWRWLTTRDDSPWYPNVRLFSQQRAGEWSEVLERVAAALEQRARQ
jgi:hypothetical protein